ncbi:MAG: hypothetical protein FD130_1660, partial [Halothiobacillaceae bacterium]
MPHANSLISSPLNLCWVALRYTSSAVLLLLSLSSAWAQEILEPVKRVTETTHRPRIALVIDDLGHQSRPGERAVALPGGPITFAVLPHTAFGARLAEMAHDRGHQVILHLPMEPLGHHSRHPGMLTSEMSQAEFVTTLRHNIAAVPHIEGINNHMGSALTQQPQQMAWLMSEIKQHGALFFLDSRTTPRSVAYPTAMSSGILSLNRDIFLDNERSPRAIEVQFGRLLAKAKSRGYAIGIGHPYPETLEALERYL